MAIEGVNPISEHRTEYASDNENGDQLRELAAVTGQLYELLAPMIPQLVQATPDERERMARDGLAKLCANNSLTDDEVAQVSMLLRNVRAANVTPRQRADVAESILSQLNTAGAGPLALAIAGVAASSARSVAQSLEQTGTSANVAFDIGDLSTWQECACAGAILGATAGIILGPAGVLGGAVAGAIGGAGGFALAEALTS